MDEVLDHRAERLETFLDDRDRDAVWFARPNSFAWVTGGGDNVVDRDAAVGVAAAGYDRDRGFRAVANNIEADRLRAEELPDEFDVEAFPWYEASLGEAVAERSPDAAAADFDAPGVETVDASPLRRPLSADDVERYRELGTQAANAVESVARELEPADTELEVAAAVRIALSTHDVNAPVVLVGGADRVRRYRHYTPTESELGDYALLSVTAEKGGLYASCTRTVAFDPPEWLGERHAKAAQVEVSALGATRAVAALDGTAGSVMDGIQAAYEHVDHPDEWQRHHQGGAAGYAGREWIATPDLDEPVETPMAYAYNPTVQGAKSEDTVLVTADGFEVLTDTGDWPTSPVRAFDYEAALERPDVLSLE